ncbi:hypothetical protein RHSIM_Rhsim01G0024800 [Rhododendron simsii]|uniref:Uncharacterized protein n=1 Tax=Rhododendron simsii TaxID=118357 RepID=A0A834LYN7_RHOSS|nr:hypothetical protein RHSIM_Rhsim01G0024800 [Rhododendron simsii]
MCKHIPKIWVRDNLGCPSSSFKRLPIERSLKDEPIDVRKKTIVDPRLLNTLKSSCCRPLTNYVKVYEAMLGELLIFELRSLLVRMIFETMYVYDDESKKAVDDVIERALSQVDIEVTTCLLKSPIARIIPRRLRDKWIKANCDAGFEEVEGGEVICVGAIVFTCLNGKVKGYRRVQFYGIHCPSFTEFRGFELAIDESILRKYNKVLIEMDCNNVVNALRGGLPFPTKHWDDYRNLPLKSMKDYEICHIF